MRLLQILTVFSAVCMFSSCSKQDDFTKFIDGKEKIYPAIMDSTIIRSGKNRVQIEGKFHVNSGVSQVVAYWNNKRDSLVHHLEDLSAGKTVAFLVEDLPEGPINFEIHTKDELGHVSVPQYISGNVYGERYRQGLLQRERLGFTFLADGMLEVDLQNVSPTIGYDAMRVKYNDAEGNQIDTVVKTKTQDFKLILPKYSIGEQLSFQTVFRPDTLSIDTFMVNAELFTPKGDITALLLKNYQAPFYASDYDGSRWGTLGDWNTNEAMKNHGGKGGYSSSENLIDIETGWGSAAIVNGKIQQTITLNPGKYRLSVQNDWTTYSENPPVHLVVSAPNSEIPDIDNLSQATAYGNVNSDGVYFEITETQVLNIGLLVNMYPENIYRVRSFKLELQ